MEIGKQLRVVMLSSALNSTCDIYANIEIMRAFVRFRLILASNEDLACRLDVLEKKYDAQFRVVLLGNPAACRGHKTDGVSKGEKR